MTTRNCWRSRLRAKKPGMVVRRADCRAAIAKILPHALLRGPRAAHLEPHFGLPNRGPDRYGQIPPWRALTVGAWHGVPLATIVAQCGARMTGAARGQLTASPFQFHDREAEHLLARVTPRDLGFSRPASLANVLNRALDRGLLLCAREHVLALLLSAIRVPLDRPSVWICVIAVTTGSRIHRYELSDRSRYEGTYLRWTVEELTTQVGLDESFVFLLPEAHHAVARRVGSSTLELGHHNPNR